MSQHECCERVGVGDRPDAVGIVVWVRRDRVLDALDERIHAGAAHVGQKIGRAAEPPAIRGALADCDRAAAAANAKACHLIHGERRSVGRLGRNPRMYAEVAAPSDRARRVHLYHPLWSYRGIRRQSDRRAAGAAPVADRIGIAIGMSESPAGAAAGAAAAASRIGACLTISRDGRDNKSPSALMRTALKVTINVDMYHARREGAGSSRNRASAAINAEGTFDHSAWLRKPLADEGGVVRDHSGGKVISSSVCPVVAPTFLFANQPPS